ncbi:MAG: Maf family protein, partial [Clostridia bacterium]|nr:Maf family protein [Clostridia bacterium]
MVTQRRVILASASPRRRELLARMGVPFEVSVSDVDENVTAAPSDMVRLLCVRKADAVCARFDDAVVIAADTLVSLDGRALGKPADAEDARRMLAALSGRTHQVMTGLCIPYTRAGRRDVR